MIYIIRILNLVILSPSHVLNSMTHDLFAYILIYYSRKSLKTNTQFLPLAPPSMSSYEAQHDGAESEYFCNPPPHTHHALPLPPQATVKCPHFFHVFQVGSALGQGWGVR